MRLLLRCKLAIVFVCLVFLIVATGCDMGTYDKRFKENAGATETPQIQTE